MTNDIVRIIVRETVKQLDYDIWKEYQYEPELMEELIKDVRKQLVDGGHLPHEV